jgi:Alpha/beta hydrolase
VCNCGQNAAAILAIPLLTVGCDTPASQPPHHRRRKRTLPPRPITPSSSRTGGKANRLALGDELNQAQAAQARADALKNQHPDWARGQNIPPPNKPGAIFDDRLKYEAWQRQYTDALNGAKYLPDLQAVDKAVKDNPNRKLMLLDTHNGSQARAAIAIGDPDTARHVSITTPGLNTTVHGSIGSMTEEAKDLRQESLRQLQAGHVFTMETPDDPIQMVYDGPPLTHLGAAALPPPFNVLAESTLSALDATGAGQFGPNPATNPNFTHLATGPAVVPDGLGGSGSLSLEGAHGHSDYPRFNSDGLPRTTNYNIAAIIAGLGDDAVRQKQKINQ